MLQLLNHHVAFGVCKIAKLLDEGFVFFVGGLLDLATSPVCKVRISRELNCNLWLCAFGLVLLQLCWRGRRLPVPRTSPLPCSSDGPRFFPVVTLRVPPTKDP